jgi:hypothetical protein
LLSWKQILLYEVDPLITKLKPVKPKKKSIKKKLINNWPPKSMSFLTEGKELRSVKLTWRPIIKDYYDQVWGQSIKKTYSYSH